MTSLADRRKVTSSFFSTLSHSLTVSSRMYFCVFLVEVIAVQNFPDFIDFLEIF